MRIVAVLLAAASVIVCGFVPEHSPPPEECWFLKGETIGFEGAMTLGELGMGSRTGEWNDIRVRAWITADPVDLWGTGELTRGICTRVLDDGRPITEAYVDLMESTIGWNSWPPGQMPTRDVDDG